MRFKKGSKVEVFSTKEVPSGSWWPAEIISGNGHNYSIRYDGRADATDVERVPRKAIRPCPPQLGVSENWVPGDVIEVLNNFSWKMATVSQVLEKKHLRVRLVGSSRELKVSKFNARVRQSWQDHKWVVIGKGFGSCEDGRHDEKLILKYNRNSGPQVQCTMTRKNLHAKDTGYPVMDKMNFQESRNISSQTPKRKSPYCYSQVEACAGAANKSRAIEKEGILHRLVAANSPLYPEQVEAVTSPREMLREKYIHASFNNRTGYSEMDVERRKQIDAVGCSLAINLDSNDANSPSCSVGSCSITSSNSYRAPHHFPAGPVEDIDGHFSDAESFYQSECEEENCLIPTKEELAAEIHRLELHAYRCTMEALYVSGPLSWEQEALVTNLRLSLHISNDEHLMELRNLGSSVTSIAISRQENQFPFSQ